MNKDKVTIDLKKEYTEKIMKIVEQIGTNRHNVIITIIEDFLKDYVIKKDGTIEYIGTKQ